MKINFIFGKRRKLQKEKRYKRIQYVSSFSDVPSDPGDVLYIVKGSVAFKWLVFSCPNSCGRRVEVNLMKKTDPRWDISIKKGKASLFPSVIVNGCGAHFWIKSNRAIWFEK